MVWARGIEMGLTGGGKSRMAGFGEEGCAAAEVLDALRPGLPVVPRMRRATDPVARAKRRGPRTPR